MNKIKEELLTLIMNISIQLEDVGISLKALNLLKVWRFIQWGIHCYIKDRVIVELYPYQGFPYWGDNGSTPTS